MGMQLLSGRDVVARHHGYDQGGRGEPKPRPRPGLRWQRGREVRMRTLPVDLEFVIVGVVSDATQAIRAIETRASSTVRSCRLARRARSIPIDHPDDGSALRGQWRPAASRRLRTRLRSGDHFSERSAGPRSGHRADSAAVAGAVGGMAVLLARLACAPSPVQWRAGRVKSASAWPSAPALRRGSLDRARGPAGMRARRRDRAAARSNHGSIARSLMFGISEGDPATFGAAASCSCCWDWPPE